MIFWRLEMLCLGKIEENFRVAVVINGTRADEAELCKSIFCKISRVSKAR